MSTELPLRAKVWRYLSYGWMLEEPSGDIFARHAGFRGNREHLRRWLPHYVMVHLVLAVIATAALMVCDSCVAPAWLTLPAGLACGIEVSLAITTFGIWITLVLDQG